MKIMVLTVSDKRTEATDESGMFIMNAVKGRYPDAQVSKSLIPNDAKMLNEKIASSISSGAEVIIITGGTGVSMRDITVDSIKFDKVLPGFGELFRHLSFTEIGSHAMMSRATLGIKGGVPIFCLPGSLNAVHLAMDKLILPEIEHVLEEVRK